MFLRSVLASLLYLGAIAAQAQHYPTAPVRILVAFSAGSQTDVLARLVAPKLSEAWRQPVIVENRPGGAGAVAGGALVHAAADGHTLMMYSDGHAVNAALNSGTLPYDTLRDIARVSQVATMPSVLVAGPALKAGAVSELVAIAKSRPGALTFGSAGIGGGLHFAGEFFKAAAGIQAVHVPFKGTQEALAETMAGRIDYMFSTPGLALPLIRSGKVIALAVGSGERLALLPQVPTMKEAGLAGFDYDLWLGLFAPAKTPRRIVEQISADIARVVSLPEVSQQLAAQGFVHKPNTPEQFDQLVRAQVERLRELVNVAGIKLE